MKNKSTFYIPKFLQNTCKSCAFIFLLFTCSLFFGQTTTLISPTINNGGFEEVGTGWFVAQDWPTKGIWYVGSATKYAGNNAAYISNNGGYNNDYTGDVATVQHIYRSIAFPAGQSVINLSFFWKGVGEGGGDYDNLKVYVSSTAPTAGTTNAAAARVGATYYNLQTTWQKAEITLPANLAGTTKYLIFQWKQDTNTTGNSAAAIDNITLTTQVPVAACTGTPNPGNTVASVNPVPAGGGSTVLSVQNATAGSGVTYQWKSSADGVTFTNIAGATSSTYTATITASTFFRCAVTCGGNMGTSNPLEVTIPYCTPNSGDYRTFINNFSTTGGLTNISSLNTGFGYNGYQNFYNSQSISIAAGNSFVANFTLVGGSAGVNIWVDWNRDSFFDDSEKIIVSNAYLASGNYNGTYNIPNFAVGNYRMRIVADYYSTSPSSCNLYGNNKRGEGEDYKIQIVNSSPCLDTPTGGLSSLSLNTGPPSTSFTATVTGDSAGSGLTYQWQISNTGTTSDPWIDIMGATGPTANLNAVPFSNMTRYYRRKITCTTSRLFSYSTVKPFVTTTSPGYCTPTTNSKTKLFISSFKFVGTLNNPSLAAKISGGGGYSDYTGSTPIAQQPDGSVINIEAISSGSVNNANGNWKAWVDWNGDGDFNDDGEQVYNLTDFYTNALTFGFVIPSGQAPGKYRVRLMINFDKVNFGPCTDFVNGEVEDYSFEVVYNCPAKVDAVNIIASDGHRCGPGVVTLSASGNGTNYNWYNTITGGSSVHTGSTFTTPSLSTTTVYYVTAINGSCESAYRIPVTARIDPLAQITFSATPSVCGETTTGLKVSGSGDKYVDLIVDEPFTSDLGKFTSSVGGDFTDDNAKWKNRPSPFVPQSTTGIPDGTYEILSPALSSGYFGGNFAAIITDISRNKSISNDLTLTKALDLKDFINLTVDFDLYYFSITTLEAEGYLKIEYSENNGASWNTLQTITSIQGNPSVWRKMSIPIPGPYTSAQFKLRFVVFSLGSGINGETNWKESIATVDNIKIYGDKPITSGFMWSDPASLLYQADCTTPLGAMKASSICIKPSAAQIENDTSWTIAATASFNNGCDASNSLVVPNNTNTWNTALSNDWNTAEYWKPSKLVPDNTKCVVIKQPVIVELGVNAVARTVTVETGGKLTITKNQSLTVTDGINNKAGATNFVVENDANLLQINDAAVNTGDITVKRNSNLKRLDYTYWAAPVKGQNLKQFSPGTVNSRFYTYNESTDLFESIDPVATNFADNGLGYAIRANNFYGTTVQSFQGNFIGIPNNGVKSINLKYSGPNQGYNLVGNPYSSNINFYSIQANNNNKDLIYNTAYFWTNINPNPKMQGSGYPGTGYFNNYAVLNGIGGVSATISSSSAERGSITPNEYIKVGQGFIVKAKKAGTLSFENAFRTSDNRAIFFNKNGATPNRYWLKLSTPLDVVTTQLIGYKAEATNDFDPDYDAELLVLGDDAFFSILEDKKLAIQGKSSFLNTDVVTLGSNHYEAGNYTIALDNKEGIFANGQNIYLKDKTTGIITNLSENEYTFNTGKGLTEGRFEIVYQPQIVLGTGTSSKENLIIYRNGFEFVVRSLTKNITGLEVYDTSGKLLMKMKPNQKETRIDGSHFINGVYILKINQGGEITTRKIMK